MKIDKQNGLPKFYQLKEEVIRDIAAGHYPVNSRLPTERDIMKTYKVSSITVSRAMRELAEEGILRRKVGDGTYVERIPATATIPNLALPQILLCSESKDVSPCLDPCNWFIESEIRYGFVNECRQPVNFADFSELEERIANKDNIAVALLNPPQYVINLVANAKIKYIIIDHDGMLKPGPLTIKWNQLTGIYELISYLFKIEGHRKIGLIIGNTKYHDDRLAGYKMALHTLGIPLDETIIIRTENGSDLGGYQAVDKLLALKEKPTAIFVDTDLKAVGAIKALQQHGLRVPEDISVAGFDDMPGVGAAKPSLTTVKAPYSELGSSGAKFLEEVLKGNESQDIVNDARLQTRLVVRESTAPCNQMADTVEAVNS